MEDNNSNILKGVKLMVIALPLMIIGPVLLTIGFRALNDGVYIWIGIGVLILLLAIVIAFMGIKTILKGLFD